ADDVHDGAILARLGHLDRLKDVYRQRLDALRGRGALPGTTAGTCAAPRTGAAAAPHHAELHRQERPGGADGYPRADVHVGCGGHAAEVDRAVAPPVNGDVSVGERSPVDVFGDAHRLPAAIPGGDSAVGGRR